MDFAIPLVTISLIGVIVLQLAVRTVPPQERRRLFTILLIAFLLRLTVATVFATVPSTRLFHEDAEGYENVGMTAARGWRGEGPPLDLSIGRAENAGYLYITAAIYYVFGASRAAPSYVNALLGAFIVFFVYRLALRFFHPVVARRAALWAAFFPSMILWSSVALKDPISSLLILVALSGCVRLKERFSLAALLETLLPIIAIQPIRFYLLYFLGFAIVLSMVLERGGKILTGVSKQVVLGGAFLGLILAAGMSSGVVSAGTDFLSLERVNTFRQGMASTANSGFAQDVDISTPGGALAFLPLGLVTLLFAPFPWQFTSLRAILAAPETIFWWTLFPALFRGVRMVVRKRFTECSPILVFSATLLIAYSFVHGNVGSGFRQRAQIFVFLFIFAALGKYQKNAKRHRIDEEILFRKIPVARPSASMALPLAGAGPGD